MSVMIKGLVTSLLLIAIGVHADDQSTQMQLDQIRFQQMQTELETMRLQAETARLQRELTKTDNFWEDIAKKEAGQKAAADRANEISDLQDEFRRVSVSNTNNLYGLFASIGLLGLGYLLRKKMKSQEELNFQQKFGVLVMVASVIVFVFLIVISSGWRPSFDFVQNLMRIRIMFWEVVEQGAYFNTTTYGIDFPTKYLLMLVFIAFAYGFTTFLGITRAWNRARSFIAVSKDDASVEQSS